MNFNFSLLNGKLNENELEIVYSYVRRNKDNIIRGLIELDQKKVVFPIKEVPIVNGTQIEEINNTFSLTREEETIFVELIE